MQQSDRPPPLVMATGKQYVSDQARYLYMVTGGKGARPDYLFYDQAGQLAFKWVTSTGGMLTLCLTCCCQHPAAPILGWQKPLFQLLLRVTLHCPASRPRVSNPGRTLQGGEQRHFLREEGAAGRPGQGGLLCQEALLEPGEMEHHK